jgi:TonB family protein
MIARLASTIFACSMLASCATRQANPVAPSSQVCHKPDYPSEARRRGDTGTVRIRFFVSAAGQVERAEVVQSSGHPQLDQLAVQALSGCHFHTGMKDGKPVGGSTIVDYTWALQ